MRSERLQQLFGLEGKHAVITDIGRGMSQEIAPALADAGAQVVIVNSDPAVAEMLAHPIESCCAARPSPHRMIPLLN